MSREIYLVSGHSGEYSDSRDWEVCYYEEKPIAQRHAELASAREREIVQWRTDNPDKLYMGDAEEAAMCANKWDPESGARSYTGVTYTVYAVLPGPLRRLRGYKKTAAAR